jgi:hypothetical protein
LTGDELTYTEIYHENEAKGTIIISFDPGQLEKRNILFCEPERIISVPLPKAGFSIASGPQLSGCRLRRCAVPFHLPGLNADPNGQSLPFWWRSQEGRGIYSKLVYGAASIIEGEGHGLFVLWGVWYPKAHITQLAFTDPVGWRSGRARLFCEIYSLPDHQLLCDNTLSDQNWVVKLVGTVSPRNEIVKQLPPDASKLSLTTCQRLFKLGGVGGTVLAVAELSIKEFLQRPMVHIQVSLEPQQH